MDSPANQQKLSGMIPVVRLYSIEEAEEFSRMAADLGILAVVVDLTKGSGPFDGSLGGFSASEGYSVYAAPEHVPALTRALEETLTVDPDDPLCALSNEELRSILTRPLRSNLTEWALARKLLLMRGDAEDRERTPEEKANWAQDTHVAADLRLARWLGSILILSFLSGVGLAAFGMAGGISSETRQLFQLSNQGGPEIQSATASDRFSDAVKLLMLPVVLTVSSTLVLIVAWRTLQNGQWRWMFPRVWRLVAWGILVMSVAGILAGTLVSRFRTD